MPEAFDLFDRFVRRNPLLPRAAWLRGLLRGPYHRLLKWNPHGLPLVIGGAMPVRLPAEFCSKELAKYEVETARAIAEWVKSNPGSLFVDIGCSYGYFSCGVLFSDPRARVLGVDADLPSLAIANRVCALAPDVEARLQLYRMLIGSTASDSPAISGIREKTAELLGDANLVVDPNTTNYINLDTEIDAAILPRVSLDSLLMPILDTDPSSCLVKCDVEGAEQIVIEGAKRLLDVHKPTLLISVHPPYLPRFGGSIEAIRSLLTDHGYQIDVIGIDHEEHWLCQ